MRSLERGIGMVWWVVVSNSELLSITFVVDLVSLYIVGGAFVG
jgi:hypothetical protein